LIYDDVRNNPSKKPKNVPPNERIPEELASPTG